MKPLVTPEMAKELLAMPPDKREKVISTVVAMLAKMLMRHKPKKP